MKEFFTLHIMVKPEGLELFPEYVHSEIELLESAYGVGKNYQIRTVLTPEEVELIYPLNSAPAEFKQYLSENETEHFFIQGDENIYDEAKKMKGKYGQTSGIRGELTTAVDKMQIKMEKWENFVHTSDRQEEAMPIFEKLVKD